VAAEKLIQTAIATSVKSMQACISGEWLSLPETTSGNIHGEVRRGLVA
jgi:hypothetical protein